MVLAPDPASPAIRKRAVTEPMRPEVPITRRRSSHARALWLAFGVICMILVDHARGAAILDSFTRGGAHEQLSAPFVNPATETVGAYGGYVEVIVSGTGNSYFDLPNDAFYDIFTGLPMFDSIGKFYQLNVGWAGLPLFPFAGEPNNIDNFIVFIEGAGMVAPGTVPAFNPNAPHQYHFVVEIPPDAGILEFGVSDGAFSDNGGQYDIEVFQLAAQAQVVQEPASWALLGLGLACVAARRRRGVTLT